MKQFILSFFGKAILGSLCAIVPQKKGLMLFGSGFNNFSDNPKFLFLYFLQNKSYAPIWISSNRAEVKTLCAQGYNCSYKWSIKTLWLVLRAQIFFISHKVGDIFPVVPKRGIVINLWHGTPIKKIGFDSLRESIWINDFKKTGRKMPYDRWDYFIAASPNTTFIFREAMQLPNNKIKSLGQPRTDAIYSNLGNDTIQSKIFKKIKLTEKIDKKIRILYAPTFRNNDRATLEIKHTLIAINQAIGENKNALLLFKPHPLGKAIFDDLLFESLPNIINVSTEDTQDMLYISDILITDYSSIMFDFMITDKPIISHIFDYDEYVSENGGLYFTFDEIGTVTVINRTSLIALIMNPTHINNNYDGSKFNMINSCDRILDFVKRLNDSNGSKL